MLVTKVLIFFSFLNLCFSDECTVEDYQILHDCYYQYFGKVGLAYPYLADNYFKDMKEQISTVPGATERCKQNKIFVECLNNGTLNSDNSDLIADCINVESYQNLSYTLGVELWARQFVAAYVELEYLCGNGFNIYSFAIDCIQEVEDFCEKSKPFLNDSSTDNCDVENPYINCFHETTKEKCGKPAGCYVYKDATISICYDGINCTFCNEMSAKNEGFFVSLCNDEIGFTAPPIVITTKPSATNDTTPTATNGAKNDVGFQWFICLGFLALEIVQFFYFPLF